MKSQTDLVNINQADLQTLAQLPGIGPTLAERIIEYRETAGPFENPSELSEIYGISGAMVNDILPLIKTGEEAGSDTGPNGDEIEGDDSEMGLVDEETEVEDGGLEDQEGAAEEAPAVDSEESLSEEEDLAALASEIRFFPDEPVDTEGVDDQEDIPGDGIPVEPSDDSAESASNDASLDVPVGGSEATPAGEPDDEIRDATGVPILVTAPDAGVQNLGGPGSSRPDRSQAARVQRPSDTQATRNGCSFQAVIAGAFLGGIFGLLLTTFILFFLNGGMLQFAGARSLRELENDTLTRLNDAQAKHEDLVVQMETLNELVEELNEAVGGVATQQAEISKSITSTDQEVTDLENTVLGYEEKINAVAEAAENFDVFLGGLRELIGELALTPEAEGTRSEGSADITLTVQPSPTNDNPLPESTPTPSPGPTETAWSTRTPRPTGTPIGAPAASP